MASTRDRRRTSRRLVGDGSAPRRAAMLRALPPHVKVAAVTVLLGLSAVAVLVLSLAWIDRVEHGVAHAERSLVPAIDALDDVAYGLSEVQQTFDSALAMPDREQRVVLIEELRRQRSLNEEAWRRFRATSLDLPGEAELVDAFEAALARQESLVGGIGLALVTADDPIDAFGAAAVRELQTHQREAHRAVRLLQTDVYGPALREELRGSVVQASTARRVIVAAFTALTLASLAVASVAYRSALLGEREQRVEQERRATDARRNEFEARLSRALQMAGSEPFAFEVMGKAIAEVVPGTRAELMLAPSSRAPFAQVLSIGGDEEPPGCGVSSPADCPAAHRGDGLLFPSSESLDACPYLRERSPEDGSLSAVCQPVGIAGRSLGVVHVVSRGGLPDEQSIEMLELVARRAGDRISLLRAFAESESHARTDPLTGLLNRRSLEAAVRALEAEQRQYCVAYGDVDRFKKLNDTQGHEAGDRALQVLSRVIADSVRPDDLASRYGGEEFVIVLPDCGVLEAIPVVERVRNGLAASTQAAGLGPVTISFGVAASEQGGSFGEVVSMADEALMRAKQAGRDRVLVAGEAPSEVGGAQPSVEDADKTPPAAPIPPRPVSPPEPELN